MRSNHPVVLEFYSNDCRHCRHAASSLAETAAAHPGTDWVMVDCQQPESRSLVENTTSDRFLTLLFWTSPNAAANRSRGERREEPTLFSARSRGPVVVT